MNLYEVIRWGNDDSDDGPNGEDTCFLVRAATVAAAAELADGRLRRMPQQRVRPFAQAVYYVGVDAGTEQTERILRGPYIQSAYCHGWRKWYREEAEEQWNGKE